jgi:hypothetical protein
MGLPWVQGQAYRIHGGCVWLSRQKHGAGQLFPRQVYRYQGGCVWPLQVRLVTEGPEWLSVQVLSSEAQAGGRMSIYPKGFRLTLRKSLITWAEEVKP